MLWCKFNNKKICQSDWNYTHNSHSLANGSCVSSTVIPVDWGHGLNLPLLLGREVRRRRWQFSINTGLCLHGPRMEQTLIYKDTRCSRQDGAPPRPLHPQAFNSQCHYHFACIPAGNAASSKRQRSARALTPLWDWLPPGPLALLLYYSQSFRLDITPGIQGGHSF